MRPSTLGFSPSFEGPIKGWAIKYLRRNYWRVAGYCDFDDLLQDAYIVYMRCRDRYVDVTEPRHFMRLYQTALRNHVHDVSNKRTYEERAQDYYQAAEVETSSEIAALLREAPQHVAAAIEGLATQQSYQKTTECGLVKRLTTNQELCRLAGVKSVDMRNEIKSWLAIHQLEEAV